GIFQIGFVFVAILLASWRRLFSLVNCTSELAERALLLGDGPLIEPLLHEFESRPESGICVIGRDMPAISIYDRAHDDCGGSSGEDLSRALKRLRINRIVVAMDD